MKKKVILITLIVIIIACLLSIVLFLKKKELDDFKTALTGETEIFYSIKDYSSGKTIDISDTYQKDSLLNAIGQVKYSGVCTSKNISADERFFSLTVYNEEFLEVLIIGPSEKTSCLVSEILNISIVNTDVLYQTIGNIIGS